MSLTERERTILELSETGLSDYKIARKINTDPPSVTRSRKNAQKKLAVALVDIKWAKKIGISIPELTSTTVNVKQYSFSL
jgi:DNA-binding CsgD family transcriptional regulator